MIKLSEPNLHGTYKAYWDNGAYIGDFIIMEDGYYTYWPKESYGYITSHFIRTVANKLDELNKEWDEQIRNDPNI